MSASTTKNNKPRQYILTEEIEKRLAEIQDLKADLELLMDANREAHVTMYNTLSQSLMEQREEILRLQKELQEFKEKEQSRNKKAYETFYSE